MKELSLFTGAGGGVLGSKLLGWKTIGYVEYEEYCQKNIKQRISDGILDAAPIFGDIKKFISEGYAEVYKGMVDVITAGFPCQPFSVAGKGKGEEDDRNLWPQTIECIRIIRPQYAFLENVPGLLTHKYIRRIFGDLAESGHDCRWRIISAAEVGAPHKRDRLWIVAYPNSKRGRQEQKCEQKCKDSTKFRNDGKKVYVAHANDQWELSEQERNDRFSNGSQGVADTERERPIQRESTTRHRQGISPSRSASQQDPKQFGSPQAIWATEPDVGRVAHGVASRVDRIKALGNGQVPQVVRAVWEILNGIAS